MLLSRLAITSIASALLLSCGGPQVEPRKSENRYKIAVEYYRDGKYPQAEKEAERALSHNPKNHEAHNLLGLVDLILAIKNLNLVEVSDCLTGVDAEGLRLEMDEKLKAAAAHFERAFELDPKYGEALQNRGLVAMSLEDYSTATKFYEQALEHPTRLRDASLTRANLGWAYFHLKDEVRAAKELRQSLQFKPGMCIGRYRLARVYFARGEWEKALEKFREVAADAQCQTAFTTLQQETSLYIAKTLTKTAEPPQMMTELTPVVASCTQSLPKSCLANECRALLATQPESSASR